MFYKSFKRILYFLLLINIALFITISFLCEKEFLNITISVYFAIGFLLYWIPYFLTNLIISFYSIEKIILDKNLSEEVTIPMIRKYVTSNKFTCEDNDKRQLFTKIDRDVITRIFVWNLNDANMNSIEMEIDDIYNKIIKQIEESEVEENKNILLFYINKKDTFDFDKIINNKLFIKIKTMYKYQILDEIQDCIIPFAIIPEENAIKFKKSKYNLNLLAYEKIKAQIVSFFEDSNKRK